MLNASKNGLSPLPVQLANRDRRTKLWETLNRGIYAQVTKIVAQCAGLMFSRRYTRSDFLRGITSALLQANGGGAKGARHQQSAFQPRRDVRRCRVVL